MFKDPVAKAIMEEGITVDSIIDSISVYKNIELEPNTSLIIIDEIQESTKARSKLGLFSEDGRFDVIATGSMLGVSDARLGKYKSKENPDLIPVGSEEHLLMHPMDFEEFLLALGTRQKDIDRIRDKIRSGERMTETERDVFSKRFAVYSVVGGMPAAVDANISRRIVFEKGNVRKDDDGIEHYPLFAAAFLFPENEWKVNAKGLDGLVGDPFS